MPQHDVEDNRAFWAKYKKVTRGRNKPSLFMWGGKWYAATTYYYGVGKEISTAWNHLADVLSKDGRRKHLLCKLTTEN